jgi:hypothetical protein
MLLLVLLLYVELLLPVEKKIAHKTRADLLKFRRVVQIVRGERLRIKLAWLLVVSVAFTKSTSVLEGMLRKLMTQFKQNGFLPSKAAELIFSNIPAPALYAHKNIITRRSRLSVFYD